MNDLQAFEFEGSNVRTILVNDTPHFIANDVAKVLGYKNPSKATNDHCKKSIMAWGNDSLGRRQEFKVIPESDVYRLIIKSKLDQADKFEAWVMEEVLPTIRKHGMYATDALINNPDLLIGVATQLKAEREKRVEVEHEKNLLEQTIAVYEPKISYLEMIMSSDDTMAITQIAEDYGMTANAMNKQLHSLKVQHKVNGQWILFKKYKGKGYTKSGTFNVKRSGGGTKTVMDTRWTQEGRLFIYNLLKDEGIYPLVDISDIA